MIRLRLTLLLLGLPLLASGQNQSVSLDDLAQSAQEWARENLDPDVLRLLDSVDVDRGKQFFTDLEQQLRGESVLDLASFKDTAKAMLPVLERYEETAPLAVWLKERLDYLEVADQLRQSQPPPKTKPGEAPQPRANPTPKLEREIWIQKVAERPSPRAAQPLVSRLKPIFAAQGIPSQLVWLAEVESGFDSRARSPQGAAGLFQLMPATARRFGLSTRPVDQRLDPEQSATAAAKYLSYLHTHFKDWRLALAGYNAGEGTVDKLLARWKAANYDGIAAHLPAETQMYVPRIEAILLRHEGVGLGQLN